MVTAKIARTCAISLCLLLTAVALPACSDDSPEAGNRPAVSYPFDAAPKSEKERAETQARCAAARAESAKLYAQGVAHPDEGAKVYQSCEPEKAAEDARRPWLITFLIAAMACLVLPRLMMGRLTGG